MKITKSKLKQIVKEEFNAVIKEAGEKMSPDAERVAYATSKINNPKETVDYLKIIQKAFEHKYIQANFQKLATAAGWSSEEIGAGRLLIAKFNKGVEKQERGDTNMLRRGSAEPESRLDMKKDPSDPALQQEQTSKRKRKKRQ